MAEGINAAMLRGEDASGDCAGDSARRHAERHELRVVDDAVLAIGDPPDPAANGNNVDLVTAWRRECTLRTLSVVNVHRVRR